MTVQAVMAFFASGCVAGVIRRYSAVILDLFAPKS